MKDQFFEAYLDKYPDYASSGFDSYQPSDEEYRTDADEREKVFVVQDFCFMIQKHTFLEMMYLVCEELKRRKYTS